MIDFHTHILPGIDDGSKDTDMTMQMLRMEAEQGVEGIVATPHFYANRVSVEHFLERRARAFRRTCDRMEAEWGGISAPPDGLDSSQPARSASGSEPPLPAKSGSGSVPPRLTVGAEVYYFREMGRAAQLPRLTIDGTDTLLLEMPFEQWTDNVIRDVESILEKQKLTVVLAHVERYIEFQKDRSAWDRIFEMPVIPQINAGSFLKKGGFDSGGGGFLKGLLHPDKKRKFCMNFIAGHPDFILGSDCHNLTSRRPNLAAAREEIRRAAGDEALARIDAATDRVLTPH